jgi:hypothetical protein
VLEVEDAVRGRAKTMAADNRRDQHATTITPRLAVVNLISRLGKSD